MKTKSFNKLPSFWGKLAVYIAIALVVSFGVYTFCIDILKDIFCIFSDVISMIASGVHFTWPGSEIASLAVGIFILFIAYNFALEDYNKFHNGVWKGTKPSRNNVYGSARLLTKPHDLKKAFNVWRKGTVPDAGIVIGGIGSTRNKLLTNTSKHHNLVLGGTGSGKTTSVLLPSLVQLIDSNSSFVALDPKGELFAITGKHAIKHGANVVLIDFSSPQSSDGWLPLQPAIDCVKGLNGRHKEELAGEIRILASTLIPERSETSPIWTQASRILFSGLCAFVVENDQIPDECKNLSTVAALAFMPQEKLQEIVEALDERSVAYQSLSSIAFAPAETYGGFAVNLTTALSIYADPFISPLLAKSEFQVEDFLTKQTCVYIKFNSSTEAFHPLIAAFVEQLIDSLRRLAENRCGGKLKKPVYFILEEFPQLPKISLGKTLAICRSQGIYVTVCIQSRSMLEAIYKQDSPGIFNNLSTTVFLQSEDLKTNKYYSELLGNYTVEVVSQSQTSNSGSGSSTKSYSYHKSPLFAPDDLKEWGYEIGHLVMSKGKAYACSSLPISKTFIGDELGLNGKEPNDINLAEFTPKRPLKNLDPAPTATWDKLSFDNVVSSLASALNTLGEDPRYL